MISWKIPPQNKKLSNPEEIKPLWQWFRGCCERLHGFIGLPLEFTENDGKIQKHEWVDPEEAIFEPAPEYNYDWSTQEINWQQRNLHVKFYRNEDWYSSYIQFSVERTDFPKVKITVRVSTNSPGEATLDGREQIVEEWRREIIAKTGEPLSV
jgi:hypothetical protein